MPNQATSTQPSSVKKCLVCDTTSNENRIVRGLCQRHHALLMRKLNLLSDQERIKCEQELVEAGKLLPAEKGGRPSGDTAGDPFADIVDKYIPESDKQFIEQVAKTKEQFNKPKPRKGKK